MLHELLLSLSGHPSPLLSLPQTSPQTSSSSTTFSSPSPLQTLPSPPSTLLSPPELSLLSTLSHLSTQHTNLRTLCTSLSISSASTISRAIASSILSTHLQAFQTHILTLEASILAKDPAYVGAYNIVPLAGIVAGLKPWERRMGWLGKAGGFISGGGITGGEGETKTKQGAKADKEKLLPKGAEVLDWLRRESATGYPDVEGMVRGLLAVGERAWVREVAGWVLYGRLPGVGREDFMVREGQQGQKGKEGGGYEAATTITATADGRRRVEYELVLELTPGFVTAATAESILFVGRSLGYLKGSGLSVFGAGTGTGLRGAEGVMLLRENLRRLEELASPISATSLAGAIAGIRTSLAQKALSRLLPMEKILGLLDVLREFFLLGRGEFVVALVGAADETLKERGLKGGNGHGDRKGDLKRMAGIMIKEGEVAGVLEKTWASLAMMQDTDDDGLDEELDMARDIVHLRIKKGERDLKKNSGSEVRELGGLFEDALLATPTTLTITVPSPLDLFLTPNEQGLYSIINAYLVGVRRAHLHLSGLWRLSSLRRSPSSRSNSRTSTGSVTDSKSIPVHTQRFQRLRPFWATISSATFFLAELGDFLQGEAVVGAWAVFHQWIINTPTDPSSSITDRRDPEVLAIAHRRFLNALIHSLLLTDPPFVKSLKTLLVRCDHLIALITRLNTIYEALQAQEVASSDLENLNYFGQQEEEIYHDLRAVSRTISEVLKTLAQQLSDVDQKSLGQSMNESGTKAEREDMVDHGIAFEPWKGAGVRNLLMRLDFRAVLDE